MPKKGEKEQTLKWLLLVKCDKNHRDIAYRWLPKSKKPKKGDTLRHQQCEECGGTLTVYACVEQYSFE